MNRMMQDAIMIALTRRLVDAGSWAGETHLQKATYLLTELRQVDLDLDFILYKHGPFSFELRDELASLKADGMIAQVVDDPRYGPKLRSTPSGEALEAQFAKALARYRDSLEWISSKLASRNVKELERLATAMWMTREYPDATVAERAEHLIEVKPHIPRGLAAEAVEEIDSLLPTPA